MANTVSFVIGNTYAKLDNAAAKLDKTGKHLKVHDCTLYVEIINGDIDLIKKVEFHMGRTFSPEKFISYCPVKNHTYDTMRFQTRQQTYGAVNATVLIVGRGGTALRRSFKISISPGGRESNMDVFIEHHPEKPLSPVPIVDGNFGIELELTTSSDFTTLDVTNSIRSNAHVAIEDMTNDYTGASSRIDIWRIVLDSSIACSRDRPNCTSFELVSPKLHGGSGLSEVHRVIQALTEIHNSPSTIQVNKSMGFHVHIDVSQLTTSQLIKVCQNFVKYEDAMDTIMPHSRRHGNRYCKSNKLAVGSVRVSSKERNAKLAACESNEELANLMNPGNDKYYKLNLLPHVSRRQSTIEFRHHSPSFNVEKIKNWIRFCMAFVHNSAKYNAPSHLSSDIDDDELFEMLMMYVVKDRFLCNFYRKRRIEVAKNRKRERESCCEGCSSGANCFSKQMDRYIS